MADALTQYCGATRERRVNDIDTEARVDVRRRAPPYFRADLVAGNTDHRDLLRSSEYRSPGGDHR
jgi:hypothetical protein